MALWAPTYDWWPWAHFAAPSQPSNHQRGDACENFREGRDGVAEADAENPHHINGVSWFP